jgi:5-methylthioribose kinase
MDLDQLREYVVQHNLISAGDLKITPLLGGVSSDVVLIEGNSKRFVIKQALERLRVDEEWHCDTSRNVNEARAMKYASGILRGALPKVTHVDDQRRLIAMEYFDESYVPWKKLLLAGQVNCRIGRIAAQLLAKLHNASWDNERLAQEFNTTAHFRALRLEPYFRATAAKHLNLSELILNESDRLANMSCALTHGDWSSKNMLVSGERLIILDWEVAWYGDPAFDPAFMLSLLYLKSLFNLGCYRKFQSLIQEFQDTYRAHFHHWNNDFDANICRLTQILMLARIDGKSPVEYIDKEDDKQFVRRFVSRALCSPIDRLDSLSNQWFTILQKRLV